MPIDPLSATLAVITLATALKDIIETAQAIQDSFSELPQNHRNAQKLANEVLKTLYGMEEIYQEHDRTFNKSKSLKKAITDLQIEMKSVYEQCARLIPPVSERKVDRFKMAFYSFWNREKAEKLLSALRDRVDRCSHDFQLLSSLRTEARIVEMHETFNQLTLHSSSGVHSYGHSSLDTTASMSYNGFGPVSNSQLFAFTQSDPMPITWIANTIPIHDLSNAYLRREVERVNFSLRSILTRWSRNLPADVEFQANTTSWHLERLPVSRIVVHQDAVVCAIHFQSLLQDNLSNSWFRYVNLAINDLVIKLSYLNTYEDAIVLGVLGVDLWRVIARHNPSQTSSLGLVQALTLLANLYSGMGNRYQAYSKSEEAIKILRSLAALPPKDNIMLITRLMFIQATNEPYFDMSLRVKLTVDAGEMLEGTLEITDLRSRIEIASASKWAVISKIKEISDDNWFTYAYSLLLVAEMYPSNFCRSREVAKLALAILNHLLAKYPGSDKVRNELINALTYLSGSTIGTADSQAVIENLKYIQQNITLLRQLAPLNPRRYVRHLAHALWSERQGLLALGRSTEAENAYQDLISLKNLAAAPPHFDIQIPSETEAEYYAQLAHYHYNAGRFNDAVYAAQNAVSQYSALEFMDLHLSREKHIGTLALLCKSLNSAHQYDATVSEGFKGIRIVDRFDIYELNPGLIESYRVLLDAMMEALEASLHPRVFIWAEDINSRTRKLAQRSREVKYRWRFAEDSVKFAKFLQKKDRSEDAVMHLREVYNNWQEIFGDLDNTKPAPYILHLTELMLRYNMTLY